MIKRDYAKIKSNCLSKHTIVCVTHLKVFNYKFLIKRSPIFINKCERILKVAMNQTRHVFL